MQIKQYEIKRTRSNTYSYIVLSTSYINPIESVDELENNLIKEKYVGNVLVDLLLSNGYDEDRFFEIYFDGKKLNFHTLSNVTNVSEDIRKVSVNYYSKNYELMNNSVLTKPQRFLIKNKRIL